MAIETSKLIRIMAEEVESERMIKEYGNNKTLLGRVRVIEANAKRCKTVGSQAEMIIESMESLRVASKSLKSLLKTVTKKTDMKKMVKVMDKLIDYLVDYQENVSESFDEFKTLNTAFEDDKSDSSDDEEGGNKFGKVAAVKQPNPDAEAINLKRITENLAKTQLHFESIESIEAPPAAD